MDIRQLRYFIAIVEEKSVSAAARRLHLSQPPLSQQLKAMEEELGTPLLERSGKHMLVTDAGKTLYSYALQMDQLMQADDRCEYIFGGWLTRDPEAFSTAISEGYI